MDITKHIIVHWVGHKRTSSGKGMVIGWFTEIDKSYVPRLYRIEEDTRQFIAYTFRGKIGKKLYIEKRDLTYEFLDEIRQLEKNFKSLEIDQIRKLWGKSFDDELGMYITMMKLQGDEIYNI